MKINKIVITKGIYLDKELRLLVSFDENDKPVDILDLDISKVGEIHEATVEKVLNDIDACIVKLDSGDKGFIENKKLNPEHFLVRHSENKLVCQADKFYVQISQDRKGVKPYSCNFISSLPNNTPIIYDVVAYYIQNIVKYNCEVVSDIYDGVDTGVPVRVFHEAELSLWDTYNFTGLLDKAVSKIVHLKSGANIIIEPTEAMTIIDVNSSKSYGKKSAMDVNLEALEEIARQIRLRSISGIIIVDLLKVSKTQEEELIDYSNELFKNDNSYVNVHGFTNLGLLEITRSRIFSTLKIDD